MNNRYEKFYFNHGIRLLSNLANPKFIDLNMITLPDHSLIHYSSNDLMYPNRIVPLLKFKDKVTILNQLKFTETPERFRELKINELNLIKDLNKKYVDFNTSNLRNFDLLFTKQIKKLNNTIPIINYNITIHHYKFNNHILNNYNAFIAKYKTMNQNILKYSKYKLPKDPLQHYIFVDLDTVLYNINIIRKYTKLNKPNGTYLKLFNHETQHLILELFKLLDNDLKTTSVFYDMVKNDTAGNINFIFKKYGKGVILNLKTFLSFSKHYPDYENNKKNDNLDILLYRLISEIETMSNLKDEDIKILKNINHVDDDDLVLDNLKNNLDFIKHIDDKEEEEIIEEIDIKTSKSKDADDLTIEELDDLKDEIEVPKYNVKYNVEEDLSKTKEIDIETMDMLDNLKSNNEIDRVKYNKLSKLLSDTLNKPSPYGDGLKIKDYLKIEDDDLELTKEEIKLPAVPKTLINKKYATDSTAVLSKKYQDKLFKKEMISTFLNLNKVGLIVKDIKIDTYDSILGKYYYYNIEVTDKGKSSYTIKLKVPHIYEDGSYKISGNKYKLKKQRKLLPIKKIEFNKVALNSGYGKINVFKAPMKKFDLGYKIKKILTQYTIDGTIPIVTSGSLKTRGLKLPYQYTIFGRYVKSFSIKGLDFFFNYPTRMDIFNKEMDIKKIENNKYIIVGKKGSNPIVMDFNNELFIYDKNKYTKIDNLYTILNIDETTLIKESSMIKIYKNYIPVVFILSYYLGLENLLKYLKVDYEILEGSKRIKDDESIIYKFLDKTVVIKPNNKTDEMILNGLNVNSKNIKKIPYDFFNNKNSFGQIFKDLNLNIVSTTEIKLLEHMFIDINTENLLKQMKEPTTFIGLLIRSSELLTDDLYQDTRGMDSSIIKGYSRVPQYIHKTLVDSLKIKTNEEFFGRSKLNVNPFSVWKLIGEDNGGELVDDLNPIAYIKQSEDLTFLGFQGKSKEIITEDDRAFSKKDIGIVSESVKDSTDVGISTHLSASPKLKSTLGITNGEDKELEWHNVVSTNTMVSPFLLSDDPKRILYSGIQASHVIPIDNPKIYPVRNEYDTLIIYKLPKKYGDWAIADGVVSEVSKNKITIKYKDKKQTYTFNDWTSKEESNVTFKHSVLSNVVKNQKVKKGDILYYDLSFFEPDIFDKTKVVYRTGTYARVSLVEIAETFEDAFLITKHFSDDVSNNTIAIRDVTLSIDDKIQKLVDINANINSDDLLFILSTDLVESEKMSKETMDLLQGFVKSSPRAKYTGKLVKMEAYYNGELKDFSSSMKKLVEVTKPFMYDDVSNTFLSGKVDKSYSINGVPLDDNKIHIKFFIESGTNMTTGDKGIVSNQLKTTVTSVTDIPIETENGDKIDLEFSYTGIYNRITPSADLMGTTALVLDAITKKAVDMYFK